MPGESQQVLSSAGAPKPERSLAGAGGRSCREARQCARCDGPVPVLSGVSSDTVSPGCLPGLVPLQQGKCRQGACRGPCPWSTCRGQCRCGASAQAGAARAPAEAGAAAVPAEASVRQLPGQRPARGSCEPRLPCLPPERWDTGRTTRCRANGPRAASAGHDFPVYPPQRGDGRPTDAVLTAVEKRMWFSMLLDVWATRSSDEP